MRWDLRTQHILTVLALKQCPTAKFDIDAIIAQWPPGIEVPTARGILDRIRIIRRENALAAITDAGPDNAAPATPIARRTFSRPVPSSIKRKAAMPSSKSMSKSDDPADDDDDDGDDTAVSTAKGRKVATSQKGRADAAKVKGQNKRQKRDTKDDINDNGDTDGDDFDVQSKGSDVITIDDGDVDAPDSDGDTEDEE